MAIFKLNFDTILADDNKINAYFESASDQINSLLDKYSIRDAEGNTERISWTDLKSHFSLNGFFQATLLKSIFFDHKQSFVPSEITYAYRNILSDPPMNIKAFFLNTFIRLLSRNGWYAPLIAYLENEYNLQKEDTIILYDLKDYSLGFGVYQITLTIQHKSSNKKVFIFLKRPYNDDSYNELVYFELQKEFLPTARHAKLPSQLFSVNSNEVLLISPSSPGVSSDAALSLLVQAYNNANHNENKSELKKSLEILIEAYVTHAALGDLLGRNDRNLMNSLIAFIIDGKLQKSTLDDLNNTETVLVYGRYIVTNKTLAISLIDIDLKWLLQEKNADWILADIDFGLSELNLLILLPEFNLNFEKNLYYEKRKQYIRYYIDIYCQTLSSILEKKELIFAALTKIYPPSISTQKLKILFERIDFFEKSKAPVIEIFKRFLNDFRIRYVYKEALVALDTIATTSNDPQLLNMLKEADLLKFIPPKSTFDPNESSVLMQLQCFRGVLSIQNNLHSETNMISWEAVALKISTIAEKFNAKILNTLQDKISFIKSDTRAILQSI